MEFGWSTDQKELRAAVIEFAQNELSAGSRDDDSTGSFPRDKWEKCGAFGIQGLHMPEQYSGSPARDLVTSLYAMDALGYACADNGLTFALNAQMWTVQLPILLFGSEYQKERFLPAMCRGEFIGAHAVTEEHAGSDVYSMHTRAVRCDGGYRLTGRKCYVTCAPIANLALVFAITDPEKGKWGLSVFIVETNSDGCERGPVVEKMGLRTAPFGDLILTDCFVPESNRLGPEGAGLTVSSNALEYERCCILVSQLGAMERQLEQSIEYAKTREQFGRPIGKFQAVSHRLVDMKLRLETSRLLLYQAAWRKQQGENASLDSALVKLHLSESFVASGLDSIRTMGGLGYTSVAEIERSLRDAIGGVLYAGTNDIQRNNAARAMGIR
ncbi:MAG: acyl-CoA dehydrogenase family protein [Rhodothermia bacterium]|nr:acyl-CoA dehydrogenase family protein [Rhodothermia bacterium]